MDICTIAAINHMTLQSCIQPSRCIIDKENNRQLCVEGGVKACDTPKRFYVCKRPDGTEYTIPENKVLRIYE